MWDLIVSVPDHCLSFYFSPCRNGATQILFPCVDVFLINLFDKK